MATMDATDTLHRLRTISGHIEGITRMVEDEEDCLVLIQQIQAMQAGLKKVSIILLDKYLRTCLQAADQDSDPLQREWALRELRKVLFLGVGRGPEPGPRPIGLKSFF
jgi:DNA-binding FrmR family transcriptional regulator